MGFDSLRNREGFSPTSSAANDYTEKVVRGLVHKMNNLLTVFHGYSSLMEANKKLDSDTRDCVQEIKIAADGTSNLLARLVTVARQPTVHAEPVKLKGFFASRSRSLEALVVAPAQLEIAVHAKHAVIIDPSIFKQVLIALITNASQAMEGEGIVRVESMDSPGLLPGRNGGAPVEAVDILILDNGRGLAEGIQEKIFDPFFSQRKELGCLGLGLATARHGMDALGGTIAIASQPGEGTCVRLTLPKAC